VLVITGVYRQSYRTGVYSRMPQPRSKIHIAFRDCVVLKGINGLLELIGGSSSSG